MLYLVLVLVQPFKSSGEGSPWKRALLTTQIRKQGQVLRKYLGSIPLHCICCVKPAAENRNTSLAPFASNDTQNDFTSGRRKKDWLFYTSANSCIWEVAEQKLLTGFEETPEMACTLGAWGKGVMLKVYLIHLSLMTDLLVGLYSFSCLVLPLQTGLHWMQCKLSPYPSLLIFHPLSSKWRVMCAWSHGKFQRGIINRHTRETHSKLLQFHQC